MAPGTRMANCTAAAAPTSGSQTITETNHAGPSGTLRLRADLAEPEESPRVRWAEDVIDNEGMGKKSSKVCCIYHKPKEPGDSDTESSSSDDDSDREPDLSRAQKAGGKKGRGRRHDHDHGEGGGKGKGKERKPSPNAYERQPKSKKEG
ncbi:Type 1 phosphatases regulator [Teratosphaeria destructans]|uniref:Type 1 phosphatases regulator n=1 Tax=Teratosphaeria destructans TaxID=418781 RepID=A0A9W7SIV2_9PEZI|nr:Type 1 phosphatases regulator [Teratosphaeria destructans]